MFFFFFFFFFFFLILQIELWGYGKLKLNVTNLQIKCYNKRLTLEEIDVYNIFYVRHFPLGMIVIEFRRNVIREKVLKWHFQVVISLLYAHYLLCFIPLYQQSDQVQHYAIYEKKFESTNIDFFFLQNYIFRFLPIFQVRGGIFNCYVKFYNSPEDAHCRVFVVLQKCTLPYSNFVSECLLLYTQVYF